jgi:all-trans-8'-apo-beta-carotenal 15,15'-oxygenase
MLSTKPAERLVRSYDTVRQEVDQELEIAEGKIPEDLRGVLFRNGSGRMERGGVFYGHPFDGDGMLSRFAFTGKGIRYRNRFVRTRWYLDEEKSGRIRYRNFGTNIPGGLLNNAFRIHFKNAANTSVLHHGNKLLALCEAGAPHEVSPETLETHGPFDFDGMLRSPDPVMRTVRGRDLPFSAHPRLDPSTGDLFNFGVAMGIRPDLMLYRVGSSGRMDPPRSVRLPALGFLHDFALTRNWMVFFFGPLTFDIAKMLLGLKPAMACASFAPQRPTEIILVQRNGERMVQLQTDPGFIFHFSNGFENERARVIVDGPLYDRFPEVDSFADLPQKGFGDFPRMIPTRFVLDPEKGTVNREPLSEHPGELPRIHPGHVGRPYRYFWMSATPEDWGGPYFSGIAKVDLERRKTLFRDFSPDLTSEPLFVPRQGSDGEDRGWLLHTVYRVEEHRTDLLVLDATDLSTACLARLPHHESPGFHGTWLASAE